MIMPVSSATDYHAVPVEPGVGTDIAHVRSDDRGMLLVYFSAYQFDWFENDYPFRFSFMRTARQRGQNALMLRDRRNLWYRDGIDGAGSVEAIAALIQKERQGFDRLVLVGASMGGYAALLFGALTQADAAVAIVPQIRVGRAGVALDDDRFDEAFAALDAMAPDHPHYRLDDLLPGEGDARFYVVLGNEDLIDIRHAMLLREHPRIRRLVLDGARHAEVARTFVDDDLLSAVIEDL